MSRILATIFVALSLGLAWAIRGHFGHEWGACWAGALASLAVLVTARRKDWARRMPVLVFLGGIGWAVGGMMSYGRIVGYGRANDFINVYYGLSMLGVVGGLYGLIGGGLLGLGLESTEDHRPDWPALLTEMIAGAILFWGLLIYQFEWLMTPPRSELWAACLGAAAAMIWFLSRNGFWRALRVAGCSALGAGFGFAFGNFVQTLGCAGGWSFNWWNVMEFSLGFFGGLGLAFGIFTNHWPEGIRPSKTANWIALTFLVFAVPATNILHAFSLDELAAMAERLSLANPLGFARTQMAWAWLITLTFLVAVLAAWHLCRKQGRRPTDVYLPGFLASYGLLFLVLGHLKKGAFVQPLLSQPEQVVYWGVVGLLAMLWLAQRGRAPAGFPTRESKWRGGTWVSIVLVLLIGIGVLSLISVNCHTDLPGAHHRF